VSIPGLPPDLILLPKGCPFAERCTYRIERCIAEMPPLESTGEAEHIVACWRWEEFAKGAA
jgi:oligopeptide/dipeptide ABC transporter ATP-binding protein